MMQNSLKKAIMYKLEAELRNRSAEFEKTQAENARIKAQFDEM
jgi:hypothetical protein